MSTVPPTNAEIDAWVESSGVVPVLQQMVQRALAQPGEEVSSIIVAYTQNDGTQVFSGQGDDPTSGGSQFGAIYALGLIAEYGAINIREYTYTFNIPTLAIADVVSDATRQATLNNQSDWFTAP